MGKVGWADSAQTHTHTILDPLGWGAVVGGGGGVGGGCGGPIVVMVGGWISDKTKNIAPFFVVYIFSKFSFIFEHDAFSFSRELVGLLRMESLLMGGIRGSRTAGAHWVAGWWWRRWWWWWWPWWWQWRWWWPWLSG